MHTKDELLRQRRRQLQDEEWKKKIDSEFEERNKKLEKDMSEKQRAAEWLQAIHKAIELIRSKKNKKGKKTHCGDANRTSYENDDEKTLLNVWAWMPHCVSYIM